MKHILRFVQSAQIYDRLYYLWLHLSLLLDERLESDEDLGDVVVLHTAYRGLLENGCQDFQEPDIHMYKCTWKQLISTHVICLVVLYDDVESSHLHITSTARESTKNRRCRLWQNVLHRQAKIVDFYFQNFFFVV